MQAQTPEGELEVRADLTVGADGRHSVVRERAGFSVLNLGAPMDVLWMRMSRHPTDPGANLWPLRSAEESWFFSTAKTTGRPPTSYPRARLTSFGNKGFRHFARTWSGWLRFCKTGWMSYGDWDDIKLLTVAVDRLSRWFRPGLLCIGDAAHAMSPIGGVGINLAIQDAVATANILGRKLRQGTVSQGDLQAVQRRRTFPTRATQRMQVIVQNNVIRRVLGSTKPLTPPWPVKLAGRWTFLQRIPARVVGTGISSGACEDARSARSSVACYESDLAIRFSMRTMGSDSPFASGTSRFSSAT